MQDPAEEQDALEQHIAVRALDETVMLLTQMGAVLAKNGELKAAEQCYEDAQRGAYER